MVRALHKDVRKGLNLDDGPFLLDLTLVLGDRR